jgi:hypothetical protein
MFVFRALTPVVVFCVPVVLNRRELNPAAVLFEAVFLTRVATPSAVFWLPLMLNSRAWNSSAILSMPVVLPQ